MEAQWGMNEDQRRTADFTDRLAKRLFMRPDDSNISIRTVAYEENEAFAIFCRYNDKLSVQIGVNDKGDKYEINRHLGLRCVKDRGELPVLFSNDLRGAEDMSAAIDNYLERNFELIGTFDRGDVYRIKIESQAA